MKLLIAGLVASVLGRQNLQAPSYGNEEKIKAELIANSG